MNINYPNKSRIMFPAVHCPCYGNNEHKCRTSLLLRGSDEMKYSMKSDLCQTLDIVCLLLMKEEWTQAIDLTVYHLPIWFQIYYGCRPDHWWIKSVNPFYDWLTEWEDYYAPPFCTFLCVFNCFTCLLFSASFSVHSDTVMSRRTTYRITAFHNYG